MNFMHSTFSYLTTYLQTKALQADHPILEEWYGSYSYQSGVIFHVANYGFHLPGTDRPRCIQISSQCTLFYSALMYIPIKNRRVRDSHMAYLTKLRSFIPLKTTI